MEKKGILLIFIPFFINATLPYFSTYLHEISTSFSSSDLVHIGKVLRLLSLSWKRGKLHVTLHLKKKKIFNYRKYVYISMDLHEISSDLVGYHKLTGFGNLLQCPGEGWLHVKF